ncbi:MAG: hypothetical protein GY820_12750, partial [Gammaproteobacteria bacterium]|nr:hypothetical protein [Gammaproteobacteria bacterium]
RWKIESSSEFSRVDWCIWEGNHSIGTIARQAKQTDGPFPTEQTPVEGSVAEQDLT